MWKTILGLSISMAMVGCGDLTDAILADKAASEAAAEKPLQESAECKGNGRTDIPTMPPLANDWRVISNTWPSLVWADMRDKCIQSLVDFETKCSVSLGTAVKTDSCSCWAMGMTAYTVYPEYPAQETSDTWAYYCAYTAVKENGGAK